MIIEIVIFIPISKAFSMLLVLLLWILSPLPYMLYYRFTYGKNVEIEYFPIIGRMASTKLAFKKFNDNCYFKKHARDLKPNLDINISNDLIYGHMFMVYSPELAK